MGDYADFTGTCGENGSATSTTGLQPGQRVRLNGNIDLSGCMIGADGACIYAIMLLASTNPLYRYSLNIDGQGPSAGGGSFSVAFTDLADDTYMLTLYSSARKMHTIAYTSPQPAIVKIAWGNASSGASEGQTRLTSTGKAYETSPDIPR